MCAFLETGRKKGTEMSFYFHCVILYGRLIDLESKEKSRTNG